jgi:hypothetical protein
VQSHTGIEPEGEGARRGITELQQQMTDKALKMAAEVEKRLEVATGRKAKGFLKVHCGLSSRDLGTYVKFSKTLKGADLDTSEIAAIRRRNRTDKMSRAQAAEKDRAAVIAAELRRRVASSSTALDQETDGGRQQQARHVNTQFLPRTSHPDFHA